MCKLKRMAKVALIDDHEDVLELLRLVLQGQHEFLTYTDPEQFLKEFRPAEFSLVVVDLHMPRIDGFEMFSQIRLKDKNVPVVAVTAQALPKQREKALRIGFCDYFVKPILDLEKFRTSVYSHIGGCSNPPYNPDKMAT